MVENRWRAFECELSARRAAIKSITLFPATQIHSKITYHPRMLQSCGVYILSQTEHGIKEISTILCPDFVKRQAWEGTQPFKTCVIHSVPYYTYICTCIHTYMHACIHTYIQSCMHTYIHTCIRTYMHTYMHANIHTYINTYMHACMHTYIHACIHTYIHPIMHVYIHTYMHTYIHAYMHT